MKKEAEVNVSYHLLKDSIILNYDGMTFPLAKSDKRFDSVLKAIKADKLSDIPSIVDIKGKLAKAGMEYRDGEVVYKNEPMPSELHDKIIQFQEEGLPFEIFTRFWENLKRNPSTNSRSMLYKFLEHNGHPLTQDGCFIAYRSVRNDFKDKHTGKFDNSPGNIVKMPREEVDADPNQTCSRGLHVAAYEYAKDFASKLLEVKVNPEHVVAVPNDYNGQKMRVCQFEVIRECDGLKTEALYNHDEPESYAEDESDEKINDAEIYLTRPKGQLKWKKVAATSFEAAASASGFNGTVYVRKGSNQAEKFEI